MQDEVTMATAIASVVTSASGLEQQTVFSVEGTPMSMDLPAVFAMADESRAAQSV